MIERVIENWLNSISEREFDIPFRLLLEQLGYVAYGRSTIHGLAELGKDVVAKHKKSGLTYFFQIKSGDATLADWNEMERQVRQMIEVPYIHPTYSPGDPYQPVWVITGQMEEAVRLSLGLETERYRSEGKPAVEVWDQNVLIEYIRESLYDIPVTNELFVVDFIRLWSRARDYQTDELEATDFFRRYLSDVRSGNQREKKKHLASYSLILAQMSHRYLSLSDIYSAIDIYLLGLTNLAEVIAQYSLKPTIYLATLERLNEMLRRIVDQLVEECDNHREILRDLFDPEAHALTEIFQLPIRIHSLSSKLALAILLKSLRNESFSLEAELLQIVLENNVAFTHVVSERQQGTLWLTFTGILRSQQNELAQYLASQTLDWTLEKHAPWGRGLLSPYEPYSEALKHLLDFTVPESDVEYNRNGHSYLLATLIKLACILDMQDDIAQHWHTISMMTLADPVPRSETALFTPLSEDLDNIQMRFSAQASWTAIKQRFEDRFDAADLINRHPELLLYLTLAYPWRAQWREIERYI